jgi:hypothetical protein
LLAASASAQMFCPAGQGLFHTEHLVNNGRDDVEEVHRNWATGALPTDCSDGFLYQGSSDLEIGNDVECGPFGQYVGIRFQGVAVPPGATIMQAKIKFTVDESTNPGDHGYNPGGNARNGSWTNPLQATIKARRSPNAPEWLPADSTDPQVVSNRDCPSSSLCLNNYDCNAIAMQGIGWGIDMLPNQDCSYFEDGRFAAALLATPDTNFMHVFGLSTDANGNPVTNCDCTGCRCGAGPVAPKILHNVWTSESTTAAVAWSPEGESIPSQQISERRPTVMTTDLSSIVQEVVDLGGWASGNSLAFVIDGDAAHDGTGALRSYESFDGSNSAEHSWTSAQASFGPTLSITYCAPVTCPADHTFHSEQIRVQRASDDVEENQNVPAYGGAAAVTNPTAGFLYQGSSDLEIGNDPETGGAQYVGIRFSSVPVPQGAIIQGASLMLTIDESYNNAATCTSDHSTCRRFSEFITAEIRLRDSANAPEWLSGNDPAVVANRQCSANSQGLIDSLCMPAYDCQAMLDWQPLADWMNNNLAGGKAGITNCDFFTSTTNAAAGALNGETGFKRATDWAGNVANIWDYAEYQNNGICNCNFCQCTGGRVPTPGVIDSAWRTESTTGVLWEPAGEHRPECGGTDTQGRSVSSCPSSARMVQFTSDFASLMQTIVNKPEWQQGNAMAVMIDGHARHDATPTMRSYESYDGTNRAGYSWTTAAPAFGPTLWVSYCQPPAVVESNNSIVEIIENLSAGVIVGIIVAVLFVICLAIVVCFMVCKEKQGKPVFTNMDKPAQPAKTTI